jgi:DNA polymerase-1
LAQLDKTKLIKAIADNKEKAVLSKKLVTLDKNVEVDVPLEELAVRKANPGLLYSFLEEKGFGGLLTRLQQEAFR